MENTNDSEVVKRFKELVAMAGELTERAKWDSYAEAEWYEKAEEWLNSWKPGEGKFYNDMTLEEREEEDRVRKEREEGLE